MKNKMNNNLVEPLECTEGIVTGGSTGSDEN